MLSTAASATHQNASRSQLFFQKRANISVLTVRQRVRSSFLSRASIRRTCIRQMKKKKRFLQFRAVISQNQISGRARIVNSQYNSIDGIAEAARPIYLDTEGG